MVLSEPARPATDLSRDAGDMVALGARLAADRRYHLAFPGATDLAYPQLAGILSGQLLNNVGDPWQDGHGRDHTKPFEIDVVQRLGRVFGAGDQVWGYVTSGASEATLHAIDEAATAHPDLIVYTSTAAHYSVTKAARLVRAPLVRVGTDRRGRMCLDDLRAQLLPRRDRAATIVTTVGTTEREAVDDVAGTATLCDDLGITRRRIHVDAALAGLPLTLLPAHERPAFGFAAGATSIVISGHKFLSTLMPCAVLLYPRRPTSPAPAVPYTGAADTTITGSRSGHTPLLLWTSLTSLGFDGHRRRADTARALAARTHDQLRHLGWPAVWQPPAFTITLAQPAAPLAHPWVLGGNHATGRIICMPGLQPDWIEEFLTDLATAHPRRAAVVPRPRHA